MPAKEGADAGDEFNIPEAHGFSGESDRGDCAMEFG